MKRILFLLFYVVLSSFMLCAWAVEIPLSYYASITQSVEEINESLQIMDGPGSSTVEPVDPNLARAELTQNTLVVYENTDKNAAVKLYNYDSKTLVVAASFTQTFTYELTEAATYVICLQLENKPLVFGKFRYPLPVGQKEMKQGKIFILQGEKVYSIQGTEIQ